MHRITVGLMILGFGTLIALPFRKSPSPSQDAPGADEPLANLDLMVLEVTENVQTPTLFEAQPEPRAPHSAETQTPQPLTYQDLAVPLEADPLFESKFNATSEVVSQTRQRESDRLAQLERVFAEKQFDTRANPPQHGGATAVPQATLTSASSPGAIREEEETVHSTSESVSVLQPLPPGNGNAAAEAEKHWIRQPD